MRPSKLSQSSLLQFTEDKFGDGRQEQAERHLALLQVENSLPFSVLEGAASLVVGNNWHSLSEDNFRQEIFLRWNGRLLQ